MNNPHEKINDELIFLNSLNLDGLELTLEPSEWYLDKVNLDLMDKFDIGHTRCDLEFASTDKEVRLDAIDEYKICLDKFYELGIELVNFHPHYNKDITKEDSQQFNLDALRIITKYAKTKNIKIMIENQYPFENSNEMSKVFDKIKDIYLLFDIAHAYYMNEDGDLAIVDFLDKYSNKIKHIHLSDNDGEDDDHYFIGYGSINFKRYIPMINEIFSKDEIFLSLEAFIVKINEEGDWEIVEKDDRKKLTIESINRIRDLIPK